MVGIHVEDVWMGRRAVFAMVLFLPNSPVVVARAAASSLGFV
jgi:hypothetical protein